MLNKIVGRKMRYLVNKVRRAQNGRRQRRNKVTDAVSPHSDTLWSTLIGPIVDVEGAGSAAKETSRELRCWRRAASGHRAQPPIHPSAYLTAFLGKSRFIY